MQRLAVLALMVGCGGDLVFEPANNYTFESQIALLTVEVEPGADVVVDWSDTDFRGRDFDGTPDQVALLGCADTKQELIDKLDANLLTQDSCSTSFLFDTEPGQSSVNASEFEIVGNPLVPGEEFLDDDRNWIFSLLDVAGGRDEALISTFVNFIESEEATTVALQNDSTDLEFTVALDGTPIEARAGGTTIIDWSSFLDGGVDVFGNPFDDIRADELLVARFDTTDVSEIEAEFLQLDTQAAELYRMSVFGSTAADMSLAADTDGNTFGGFTTEGIWLVGVGCTGCLNPAPLLLSVVEVR